VYLSRVSRRWSLQFWAFVTAVTFVTSGGHRVLADNPSTTTQGGYKTTAVNLNGKTILVKELDPYRNVKPAPPSDGKYHPTDMNFSAANPMSDKKFSIPADGLTKSDPDFANGAQSTFATKPYASDALSPTVPNLNTKASFPTTTAYSRSATGYDKGYLTANADVGQGRAAAFESNTSSYQGRTAVVGGQSNFGYASALSNKTYMKAEADGVKHNTGELGSGTALSDIPNRPLSIDEVRDLINHGFKPNTEAPPPEQSKPLNAPGYKPQPLRITPPPDTSDVPPSSINDDDKNDPVPPPGTMAAPQAPENSEPLPQP